MMLYYKLDDDAHRKCSRTIMNTCWSDHDDKSSDGSSPAGRRRSRNGTDSKSAAVSLCLTSVLMFTINSLQLVAADGFQTDSPLSSHSTFASDLFSSLSASDRANSEYSSSSDSDDSSEIEKVYTPPLFCFVCSTVNDMRCRYLMNQTVGIPQSQLFSSTGSYIEPDFPNTGSTEDGDNSDSSQLTEAMEVGAGKSGVRAVPLDKVTYETISSPFQYPANGHKSMIEHEGRQPEVGGQIALSTEEASVFSKNCTDEESFCIVRRLGVSDPDPKSTSYNFFGLQRGCSKHCEPGCFIIGNGERTKLKICTSCCDSNNCNVGNGSSSRTFQMDHFAYFAVSVIVILLSSSSF